MGFFTTAAIIGASAIATGASVYQGQKQATASKKAAEAANSANNEAIAKVQAAQKTSSEQAVNTIKRRTASMSETIYTSPLGLTGQADVSRKTLLGQ